MKAKPEVTADYPSSQQELLTVLRIGWGHIKDHIDVISAFMPKISVAYVDAELVLVDDTEAMPDAANRQAERETIHVLMEGQKDEYVELWLDLENAIENTYDAANTKIKIKAAGKEYLEKARNGKWESLKSLIVDTNAFLAANAQTLLDANTLTPTLPTQMNALGKLFNDTYIAYGGSKTDSKAGTTDKKKACNNIYGRFIKDSKTARRAYRNQPEKWPLFTFADILDSIRGAGLAGNRGLIINSLTKKPIENVVIELSIPKTIFFKSTTTDKNGEFLLTAASGKTYVLTVKADGYQTMVIDPHEIKLGTISRLELELIPITA